ncbi:hypothetical protein NQ317_009282 [Molorchus minor]|uniref:Liprin-beta-1/2 coiled-coil domain-containing protein n=1 Tax=Molorchus minor TaxID=1323400 RepID=A0ABQ9J2X2_9CUCU|nr:hypothetical protein NQ317_009282 [Molorchus minor]
MEGPEQIPVSKPPLNRPNRDKAPRREKTAPGSLDRRRHHQHRQERDQKSRSTHVPKSPPRIDDFPGEQDEKYRKMQYERDNLQLQVQVLTEQIEAQSDKISDLEKLLQEKKQLLSEAEDKLQREVLSRSSLETQKLELMSIMSELKLQQAALERENLELRNSQFNNNPDIKKPPIMPRMPSQPQLTSTPVQHSSNQHLNSNNCDT